MADISKEWRSALNSLASQAASAGIPSVNIGTVMADLENTARKMIDGSSFPGGVKNAIKNGISSAVLSETDGILTVSAVRPSLIDAGSVNLARSYHEGWAVTNPRAFYKGTYNGKSIVIHFASTPGFSGHPGVPFLRMAASTVMAKYPDVYITVS